MKEAITRAKEELVMKMALFRMQNSKKVRLTLWKSNESTRARR
jgi:hypothetical protein